MLGAALRVAVFYNVIDGTLKNSKLSLKSPRLGFTEHSSIIDGNFLLYDDKFEYCMTSMAGKVVSDTECGEG